MIKAKIKNFTQNPHMQKALHTIKPEKSIWGVFGVILFFIIPEIIAFIWGNDITVYAKESLLIASSAIEKQYYEVLTLLFEEGGNWFNLALGFVLLIWLFV